MKSLIEEASTITKAVEKAWVRAGKPSEFTIKVFEEPKYNFLGMTTKSAKVAIFFKAVAPVPPSHHEKKDQKSTPKEQSYRNPAPRSSHDYSGSRSSHHKNYDGETQQDDLNAKTSPSQRINKDDRRQPRDYKKQPENRREQRPAAAPLREREHKEPYKPREEQEKQGYGSESRDKGPRDRHSYKRDRAERPDAVWSNEMADIAQDWLENMVAMLGKREVLITTKIVGPQLKFEFKGSLLEDKEKERNLFASWAHLVLATVGNKYKKDLRGLKIVLAGAGQE